MACAIPLRLGIRNYVLDSIVCKQGFSETTVNIEVRNQFIRQRKHSQVYYFNRSEKKMDITAAASSVQQNVTRNQIDAEIAAKTLQTQKQQGEAIVALIAEAAQVQQQTQRGTIDVKA
jgi:hypothetical protein